MSLLESSLWFFVSLVACTIFYGCYREQTHYDSLKYQDDIVVVDGFYAGQVGTVVSQDETLRIGVNTGKHTIYPLSWNVEKVE